MIAAFPPKPVAKAIQNKLNSVLKSSGIVAIGNASPVTINAKIIVKAVVPVKRLFHPSSRISSDLRRTGNAILAMLPTKEPTNHTACTTVINASSSSSSPLSCARQEVVSNVARTESSNMRNTVFWFFRVFSSY